MNMGRVRKSVYVLLTQLAIAAKKSRIRYLEELIEREAKRQGIEKE